MPGPTETLVDENKKEEKNINSHFRKFYVDNKNSDLFHCPDCKCAKRVKTENKIVFESVLGEVNKKFKPCKLCSPDMVEKYNPLLEAVDKKKNGSYR